jgi:hypothetical protein
VLFPSHADPSVAQAILTDVATSIMTVVSIVFVILLMTLTLASTQFSARILVSFIRDHVTQWTLGVFLGTFSCCVATLPAVRSVPQVFVPVATVVGAMALAPICVGWLIYFIYHISNSINVNHIVDRIRRETGKPNSSSTSSCPTPGGRPNCARPWATAASHLPLPSPAVSRAISDMSISRDSGALAREYRVTLRHAVAKFAHYFKRSPDRPGLAERRPI